MKLWREKKKKKKIEVKDQLTYEEIQLQHPHPLDPHAESLSRNAIQIHKLCVHKQLCVYSHFHQPTKQIELRHVIFLVMRIDQVI